MQKDSSRGINLIVAKLLLSRSSSKAVAWRWRNQKTLPTEWVTERSAVRFLQQKAFVDVTNQKRKSADKRNHSPIISITTITTITQRYASVASEKCKHPFHSHCSSIAYEVPEVYNMWKYVNRLPPAIQSQSLRRYIITLDYDCSHSGFSSKRSFVCTARTTTTMHAGVHWQRSSVTQRCNTLLIAQLKDIEK